MKEECLICKAPLEYLNEDVLMECAICHKKELSKTRYVNGHYVCNECHTKGIDSIFGVCLTETSKNSRGNPQQNDESSVLPHARPGAPHRGRCGTFNGRPFQSADRNEESWAERTRMQAVTRSLWRVRILGCLRCRY